MKKRFIALNKIFRFVFKEAKGYLFVTIILSIIGSILTYVPLIFSEQIINLIYDSESYQFLDIFIVAVIFLIVLFITTLIKNGFLVYSNTYGRYFYSYNVILLAKRSLTLDYNLLIDKNIKDQLQKARDGQNGYGGVDTLLSYVQSFLTSIISLVIGLYFISRIFIFNDSINTDDNFINFVNSWYSGALIIAIMIVELVFNIFLLKKVNKISKDLFYDVMIYNQRYFYYYQLNTDYRLGKDIRIFQLEEMILNRMKETALAINKIMLKYGRKYGLYISFIAIATSIVVLLAYLLVTCKAYFEVIALGSIVSVVGSITNVLNSFVAIEDYGENILVLSNYLSNFSDYLNLKNEEIVDEVKIDEIKKPYLIEFKHVSFKYPNAKNFALDNVSFILGKENRLAIVGKNGAGKSTIIKLVARLYKPTKGEILINGYNINRFNFNDYQKLISVVFQDFTLFPMTIKENVATCETINEIEIKSVLKEAKFNYEKLKDGINTYLFKYIEDGVEVSGGEAQKIAIARSLYKNTSLIFLDEPTSALDPFSEAEIYTLFDTLIKDKKAIFISHRMSSTKFCDKIIVLDKGKIVEEGNHDELIKRENGIYKELFNAQAKYYK